MKCVQLMPLLGVVLLAIGMVGCATNDYDVDVDALLRQLEMDAGIHDTTVSSPATSSTTTREVPESPPLVTPSVPEAPEPPPPGELTIQPDCLVQISVEEDPALNGSYPVNEIGAVTLGYVGPVILYNKTEAQAAEKIKDILTSRHFRNATVQVRIIRASYEKVRVGGEVMSPGIVKIGAGDVISLNDALLRVGGLKPTAKGAKIKIVRNGLRKATALAEDGEVYPLVDASGNPTVPDVALRNNDVAYVFVSMGDSNAPMAGGDSCSVVVLGELQQPGVYRFKAGEPCTMLHLMFRVAGQMTPYANKKAVEVIRKNEKGWDEEMRVNVLRLMEDGDPAADIELQDGDRIVIPKRRVTLF